MSLALHQSRNRRSTDGFDVTYYKLRAFDSDLHIRLKRNDEFMNHLVTVETQNEDGTMTSHSVPENTFYLGQVSSDPGSVVALSNLGGLVTNILLYITNIRKWRTHVIFIQMKFSSLINLPSSS